MNGELVSFIELKIAGARKDVAFREESERAWRGGSDHSWRAVGCKMNKLERLKLADTHGRILVKTRHELELFEQVLVVLKTPANEKGLG